MPVLKREYTREQKALTLKCLLHYNVFFIFSPFKSTRFFPGVFNFLFSVNNHIDLIFLERIMTNLLHSLEASFSLIIQYAILLIEFIGFTVLVFSVFRGVADLIRHKNAMRLNLVEGIALALEFKIGGELLHTVIVREWDEVLFLGAIIGLKGGSFRDLIGLNPLFSTYTSRKNLTRRQPCEVFAFCLNEKYLNLNCHRHPMYNNF